MAVTLLDTKSETLHTRIEWDAEYGVQYTVQYRLRVIFTDDVSMTPEWTDWRDLVTLTHQPPGKPASPYYDNTDHSRNPANGEEWTDFELDSGGDGPPVEYRVVVESIGNKHRWFTTLPNNVGSEDAMGFGPYPNTQPYNDIFNQYVYTINRLYRARIELPLTLQYRQRTTSGVDPLSPPSGTIGSDVPDCIFGSAGCVPNATGRAIRIDDTLPTGTSCVTVRTDDWTDTDTDMAFCSTDGSGIGELVTYGGSYVAYLQRAKTSTTWRIRPDQPALNALPPNLRTHLDGGSFGLLGKQTTHTETTVITYSPDLPGTTCGQACCPIFYADEVARYSLEVVQTTSEYCTLSAGSTLTAPSLPAADFNLRIDSNAPNGCAATSCSRGGASSYTCFTPAHNNIAGGNMYVVIYPQ